MVGVEDTPGLEELVRSWAAGRPTGEVAVTIEDRGDLVPPVVIVQPHRTGAARLALSLQDHGVFQCSVGPYARWDSIPLHAASVRGVCDAAAKGDISIRMYTIGGIVIGSRATICVSDDIWYWRSGVSWVCPLVKEKTMSYVPYGA